MIPTQVPIPSGTCKNIAAFFDLDNTLLPGESSEVRFFRSLWRRGIVGWPELRASIWRLLRDVPPLSLQPLREYKLYLAGKPAQVIEPLGEEFCREALCPLVAVDGMRRIEEHQNAGHVVILVTGSLDFLIEPIAGALQVDHCLATRLEQVEGLYTGRVHDPLPYGEGKVRLIRALASELEIDLSESFAYGDSPGDVEILSTVRHPMVVNPIRGMAGIAKQKRWPIQLWR
jgi:HAD superfamily hydrolase (TIGR01490 family)